MKKSFILYLDSLEVIDKLTDEQVGKLFRKIKSYHNGNTYKCNDQIVDLLFFQFKNQFDRDLKKYENVCKRNKLNGLKGGRPKNPKNPVGSLVTQNNPKKPKKPDNDNDNDNENDSEKENDNDNIFSDFRNIYPNRKGKARSKIIFNKILNLNKKIVPAIFNGLNQFVEYHKLRGTEKQFIPHSSTRLNNARWEDDYKDDIKELKEGKGKGKNIIQNDQDYSTRNNL